MPERHFAPPWSDPELTNRLPARFTSCTDTPALTARLTMSFVPPLDLVAEPSPPMAEPVDQQRARMNRLHALSLEERAALIPGCSNGGDDSDH